MEKIFKVKLTGRQINRFLDYIYVWRGLKIDGKYRKLTQDAKLKYVLNFEKTFQAPSFGRRIRILIDAVRKDLIKIIDEYPNFGKTLDQRMMEYRFENYPPEMFVDNVSVTKYVYGLYTIWRRYKKGCALKNESPSYERLIEYDSRFANQTYYPFIKLNKITQKKNKVPEDKKAWFQLLKEKLAKISIEFLGYGGSFCVCDDIKRYIDDKLKQDILLNPDLKNIQVEVNENMEKFIQFTTERCQKLCKT